MDRQLKQYDKESMKMAILKHEETFKEQVFELHRLYRVQKLLMRDMNSSGPKRPTTSGHAYDFDLERWNVESDTNQTNYHKKDQQRPRLTIDLERPAEEYITDDSGDVVLEIEQESNIELTLGRGYSQRKKDETPLASDSGLSFSSSSTDSGAMQKTIVGNPQWTNTTEKLTGHDWSLIQIPDTKTSFQSETNNHFAIEEQLRQERLSQPPWLYHVLSLNMT
ncbi:uncharacterized protein LOC131229451 [Magnolia sinica]|uniref:uncharacterized protein LOC131229451 n=1 Tax=Magnolia sinica TaxID=86752 RepID=UPI0026590B96|nr:uncharacterized protein LOC131229451 [Magnolia sinica]XP_058081395.1 uncharacterized protein LOC131229451 [Magnolia sinica]XP_058081396.1 uncharacterized protein LOC131229451 [Magnolia sinica]XP_058081397.1 uncharacterized protein LOC131229451 [Magnolia sinica]